MTKKNNIQRNTSRETKSVVERAAEIKRENPDLKYYEVMKKAKSEINEMD